MPLPRPFWRPLPLALAVLLALVACTSTDGGGPPGPLQVTAYAPLDGAVGVATDAAVAATFDRAVDRDRIEGAFALTGPDGAVAGDLVLDAAGTGATFTPAAPLAHGTTYTASLAGSVAAVDGGTLAGSLAWSFTTEAAPDPEPDPLILTGDLTWTAVATVDGPGVDLRPQVSGGLAPIAFHVDGDLPPVVVLSGGAGPRYAIDLDPATGALTGRTPVPGVYTGSVVATDARGTTASLPYRLELTADIVYTGPSTLLLDHTAPLGHVDLDPGVFLVGGVPLPSLPPSVERAFALDTDEPVAVVADSGAVVRTASAVVGFGSFPTVLSGTIAGVAIEPVELVLESTGPYVNMSGQYLYSGGGGALPPILVGFPDQYSPPRAGDRILVAIGNPVGERGVPVPFAPPAGWAPVVLLSPPENDPLATRLFVYEVGVDDEGEAIFFELPDERTAPVHVFYMHLRNADLPRVQGATVKPDGATSVTARAEASALHRRPFGARFVFVESAVTYPIDGVVPEEGTWLSPVPMGNATRGYLLFGLQPLGADGAWDELTVPIGDADAYAAVANVIVGAPATTQ